MVEAVKYLNNYEPAKKHNYFLCLRSKYAAPYTTLVNSRVDWHGLNRSHDFYQSQMVFLDVDNHKNSPLSFQNHFRAVLFSRAFSLSFSSSSRFVCLTNDFQKHSCRGNQKCYELHNQRYRQS